MSYSDKILFEKAKAARIIIRNQIRKNGGVCSGYRGFYCENEYCPKNDKYENIHYNYLSVKECEECCFYKGCEDCAFVNTARCVKIIERGK